MAASRPPVRPHPRRPVYRLAAAALALVAVVATSTVAVPALNAQSVSLTSPSSHDVTIAGSASDAADPEFTITGAIADHYETLEWAKDLQARTEETVAAEIAAKRAAEEAARVAAEAAAAAAAAQAAAQAAASGAPESAESSGVPSSDGGTSSTGVSAPTPASNLTVVQGDVYATQNGQVLNSLEIHGRVHVQADNVIISNSIVRGSDSGSNDGLVENMAEHPGLLIFNTEVYSAVPNSDVNGIMGSHFELHNVNIHTVIDQVHIVGSDVLIENSWLHDNLHYDAAHNLGGEGASHDDNVQIQAGNNIRILNSTLSGAYNSGLQITQDRGIVSNVTYSGNHADGGGCTFNVAEKGKGPIQGLTITNNVFGRNQRAANCAVVSPESTHIEFWGNVFTDGAPVSINPGS